MVDIGAISLALNSLKIATDTAVFLRNSGLSLKEAEHKLKLADLIGTLADAKIQFSEIQQLIFDKDKQIKELEDALEIKGKLKWAAPVYYLIEGDSKEGPFCPQCKDNNQKLIRLQGSGNGFWVCKTCKNTFTEERYKREQDAALKRGRGTSDWFR